MNSCSDDALTGDEAAVLAECERHIRHLGQAGIDAGRALGLIKDRRLYRDAHPTFEGYVEATWDFGVRRAYQLADAAAVHDGLAEAGFDVLPANEAQARPLVPLLAGARTDVWRRATSSGKVTARAVQDAVDALGYGSDRAPSPEDPAAKWSTEARRALRAVPAAHHRALATAIIELVPAGAVTEDIVAEVAEGYAALVLEDGGDAEDWASEQGPGHQAHAWQGDGATVGQGTAGPPLLDLDVLPDSDVHADAPSPVGPAPFDSVRHPSSRKSTKLFLGTAEKDPLLVSLPVGLVPAPLLDGVPAGLSTTGVTRVVAEIGELERAGGPVTDGVVLLDEVRAYCEAEGVRPRFQTTTESVDWTRYTSNPLTGCWHGCRSVFCYAAGIARRMFPQGFLPTLYPDRLGHFARTPVPDVSGLDPEEAWRERSVFMVSMGDLFGRWVPAYFVEAVLAEVRAHPEWFAFFLTKHPKRLGDFSFPANAAVGLTLTGDEPYGSGAYDAEKRAELYRGYADDLGRVDGAAFTWLSVEPLRGDVGDLGPFFEGGVRMVAVGAQSATTLIGPDGSLLYSPARQPEVAWVESVRRQVRDAGAALFEKENLAVRPKEVPFPDGRPLDRP